MKRIINGKKYDTDTAKAMLSYSNAYTGFSHVCETLYRKKTGEFFLYGEGGPMTSYAKPCGDNSWSGGSRITPFTEKEARDWAERHGDADEYEAIFGEVEE